MKKERYLREMDDQNDNAFSLIADFDGNEDQVFDIKVGETLPVLPLRNMVLFPGVFMPVSVGRKSSLRLVREADKKKSYIAVVCQKMAETDEPAFEDLHPIGTIGKIVRVLEMPDQTTTVIIQGMKRLELKNITETHPYLKGEVNIVEEEIPSKDDKEFQALVETCKDLTIRYIKSSDTLHQESAFAIKNLTNHMFLVDFICTNLPLKKDEKIELLRIDSLRERTYRLLEILNREVQLAEIKASIQMRLAAIRNDEADLVVGTHAILSEGVEFARLGLAVIDEQHRFGVRQRGMLAEKAANPHLLVMSATPIPRTLGLLIYGDLDISILDELPPGRTPVKTRCITGQKRRDLYHFLDQEIGRGRQVYLVCPAIENTPDGGLNAVKSYYEDIAKALLPERRVGLMHGKLKPKEKAAVMEDFKAGRLDALVSTTVIEVGVDVPNASVMVIENAERYGLSALHQLRGRVGRGAAESWCFLVSDNQSENVQKRLKFLCSTTDGFAVAQYDLETRGPGDFFGSRQHGLPTLQIADLMNDTRTLHAAQAEAVAMLADDPLLEAPEHALLEQQVQQMFEKAGAMN